MMFYDKVRPVKEAEAQALRGREKELAERIEKAPAPRSLYDALMRKTPSIIAEIKRASPSKGVFSDRLDASAQARVYERGGAAAVSVLTEERYFHGSLADLAQVRAAVSVPVLRKDFLLDPLQVHAARAGGSDAVLLIVGFLNEKTLEELFAEAAALGLDALVEVHDENELTKAAALGAKLIGINNRNLRSLEVDLAVSERLLPLVPRGAVVVVESGIHGRADIQRMQRAGAGAFLVGEHLVRSGDPQEALRRLRGE